MTDDEKGECNTHHEGWIGQVGSGSDSAARERRPLVRTLVLPHWAEPPTFGGHVTGAEQMNLLNKIKGLAKGKQQQIDKGVDAAVKFAKDKAPDKYDTKIDKAATQVKKAADKIT